MNVDITTLYKTEQFEYFRNKKYSIFLLIKVHNWENSSKKIYITKNLKDIKDESFSESYEILTKEKLLANIEQYSRINLDEELSKEFFIYFLNKYPKLKRQAITTSYWCNELKIKDIYKDIINLEKYNTIQDFIKKFNTFFSTREFSTYTDSFENIHDYLSTTWTNEDIHLFWLDFFKQRKSSLKSISEAPKIADFLIKLYSGEEKIEAFFPFFPFLHAKFEDLEPDIFGQKTKHIDHIHIHYKKIGNVFNVKGFKREQYSNHLKSLMDAIVEKNHGIEHFEHVGKNKSAGSYYLTFYHNNDNFNMEYVKNNLISYFTYLKNNPVEKPDDYFIKKWLDVQDLDSELKKPNTQFKKNSNKI